MKFINIGIVLFHCCYGSTSTELFSCLFCSLDPSLRTFSFWPAAEVVQSFVSLPNVYHNTRSYKLFSLNFAG